MDELFSQKFSRNNLSQEFIIYRLSDNLFQAKSASEIIMLWKTNETWEGVTNLGESAFIEEIGKAIDEQVNKNQSYLST
jgi:hypothetical protein